METKEIKKELDKIILDYGLKETKLIIVPDINNNITDYIPDYDSEKDPISIALNAKREDGSGVYDIFINDKITEKDINNFVQTMIPAGKDVPDELKNKKIVARHVILHEIGHIMNKHKDIDLGLGNDISDEYKEEISLNRWAYNELLEKYDE